MTNLLKSVLENQNYKSFYNCNSKINTNKTNKSNKNMTGSIIGSAAGIAAGVAAVYSIAKKGNPQLKLKNLTYEEKDVLIMGAGSVLGGLAGGLLTDDDKNNVKPKLREASQQFFGCLAAPLSLLALGNHALKKHNVTKTAPKVGVVLASLFGGMEIGNFVMNKVNNKIFKQEVKHDVKPSDYLLHFDDLCLTANMILKDVKSLSGITSKILPATLILAGTKTGIKKDADCNH